MSVVFLKDVNDYYGGHSDRQHAFMTCAIPSKPIKHLFNKCWKTQQKPMQQTCALQQLKMQKGAVMLNS